MLEHHREQLVVGGVVVVLGQRYEGEDGGVEVVSLAEGSAREFDVVDAGEGGGHCCFGGSFCHGCVGNVS